MPSARTSRNGALLATAAILALSAAPIASGALPAAAARSRANRIVLPAPRDVTSTGAVILTPRSGETEVSKLPGPVDDREKVRVALGAVGAVDGIVVDQALMIHGVGDFDLVMPGPATNVVGPRDQATQPGLRRGEILWNGFSPGAKVLRSTVTLDTTFEQFRIPLAVSVRYLQRGRPVEPPVSGPVRIEIRVSNTTARPISMPDASAAPEEIAGLLDALRREIAAGRRPIAGVRGLPTSLAASSRISTQVRPVQIPIRVGGTIGFTGALSGARVTGARLGDSAAAPIVDIDSLLPSLNESDGSLLVRVEATARRLGALRIALRAVPALPDLASLTAPGGATWTRTLSGLDATGLRDALARAESAMWQVLLLPQVDAYLGNPGSGSSKTEYLFSSAVRPAAAPRVHAERFRPAALALVIVAAALAIGSAALLWTKS